ncbi:Wzy polymerase domain-containing protein [Neisseriaceae bacterium B1]
MIFARSQDSILSRDVWALWLGLALVMVVPFLSIYRVGPLNSFFLEAGSLVGVLVLVLLSACSGCLNVKLPRASWYLLAMAVFWWLQARLMSLTYLGLSDMVSGTFLVLALGCWAVRGWVAKIGVERALSVLAAVLVVGCTIQAAIGWMQYLGWAGKFSGYLMYRAGIVEGQLAQRNHFGHYEMWGMLSLAWLWGQRRLPTWATLGLMTLFASVMGLTGSRTIFGYVAALALLVPSVGWLSGSLKTRTALGFVLAAVWVVALQFGIEPVLNVFSGDNVQSAAERLGGSQFGGSGRGYEWQKAWTVFLSAPWFGYGWGSYALQGFLTNVYPTGFRPYEGNVLFTHSHNSFLNMLAEMGLVGTFLVLGGLVWTLLGCLKRRFGAAGLFILGLVSVSLVHSFLEYPLWYIYFLSAFVLFLGFVPLNADEAREVMYSRARWQTGLGAAMAVLCLAAIVRLGFAYQDLRQVSGDIPTAPDKRAKNIVGLLMITKTEPMLRYYAQLQLMNYFDPNDSRIPDWAVETAEQSLQYRPYANAYKWALIVARTGKEAEAREWMGKMYRYYPTKFQAYGSAIMLPEYYGALREDYTKTCYQYYATLSKLPECVKAAD